jgi:hypothetical protein
MWIICPGLDFRVNHCMERSHCSSVVNCEKNKQTEKITCLLPSLGKLKKYLYGMLLVLVLLVLVLLVLVLLLLVVVCVCVCV